LDYLGIKVSSLPGGRIILMQPHLIDTIIQDMKLTKTTKPKLLPACLSSIIQRDVDRDAFDEHWDYCSIIGKMNFLEKSTQAADFACTVHQCTRFSSNTQKVACQRSKANSAPLDWNKRHGHYSQTYRKRV